MFQTFKHNKTDDYSKLDDNQLFHLLKENDEYAFTSLYERYARYLYSLAYRYLKDEFLAENALQNVFMFLWNDRRTLVISSNVKNYLYTVMKNNVLNVIVNQNMLVAKKYEISQRQPQCDDSMLDSLYRNEMLDILQVELKKLSPLKQEIISLKQTGLSNLEIAEELGLPINTVKTYYSQCVKDLKSKFKNTNMYILLVLSFVDIL